MEKRYTALRTIGTIYKILGIVVGVLTILAVLAVCGGSILGGAALNNLGSQFGGSIGMGGIFGGVVGGAIIGIFVLLYGGGAAITLYALGEGIYLLLSLEESSRTTALMLTNQAGVRPPPPVM
jgi:hypothetical protein